FRDNFVAVGARSKMGTTIAQSELCRSRFHATTTFPRSRSPASLAFPIPTDTLLGTGGVFVFGDASLSGDLLMRVLLPFATFSLLALGVTAACSSSSDAGVREGINGSGGAGSNGPSGSTTTNPAASSATGLFTSNNSGTTMGCQGDECEPAPPSGGGGMLTPDEACDDGGKVGGDGCSANCLVVEEGYSCNPPGVPCRLLAICGDGFRSPSEGCDDGNVVPGDGCNELCKLEDNYKCDENIPNLCTPTTCGDGMREGSESCDDGNLLPYDGCSANCRAEPDCSGTSCVSACGDGLLLGEECDD